MDNRDAQPASAAVIDRPGSTVRLVLLLTWPVLVQQLLILAVSLSDAFLAGWFPPEDRSKHVAYQAALLRHGIQPYDAVIGSPYNPALHERVGSKRAEGMGPLLVAEQRERGYASQQPEFVLRRPKVIVSE